MTGYWPFGDDNMPSADDPDDWEWREDEQLAEWREGAAPDLTPREQLHERER